MSRRAKLKSTGEIVEVYADMDYQGNTTWLDTSTKDEYCLSELEFINDMSDKAIPHLNFYGNNRPIKMEDIIGFDPLQEVYDEVNKTLLLQQNFHIRINDLIIQKALEYCSDKQLKDELKRREEKRKQS
ncbi:hypothetical protein [Duncaniella freteri]|uniref:hypothetical protein n=1 Tax=Duncaniella freteri TaxID=2530391 RepID=UPI002570FD80|nr:hypothetical protein [Duncaniella freteri]